LADSRKSVDDEVEKVEEVFGKGKELKPGGLFVGGGKRFARVETLKRKRSSAQ